MISNKQVRAAVEQAAPFKSKYTGEEIESGVDEAKRLMPYIQNNLIIPAGTLTGDFLRTTIATVERSMWLHSIVLHTIRPFSESAKDILYEIALDDGTTILSIPTVWLMTQDFHLEYILDMAIQPGHTIDMVCTDTRAYGEMIVKLIGY